MALSNEQILQLAKGSDEFTTELVLTIDALADKVKDLSALIKKLEELNPTAKTPLKLVQNDGCG
jgi:hypothetical protein